jgi:hypothetical protein
MVGKTLERNFGENVGTAVLGTGGTNSVKLQPRPVKARHGSAGVSGKTTRILPGREQREPWVAKEKWTSREEEEEKRKRKLRHELPKDANHTLGNALGSLVELIRSPDNHSSADSFYPRLKSCV